jgi:hypothetical protein
VSLYAARDIAVGGEFSLRYREGLGFRVFGFRVGFRV